MNTEALSPAATNRHDRWWFALGLAGLLATATWIRWPGFTQGGFGSHDVGGILYNAMVIVRGGLPYVDTVEMKAPGSFYLAAAGMAGPGGNDIARFQVFANAWAMLGLLALTWQGRRMWGTAAGLTAGAVYVLHDGFLDSLDGNYVTWAALPQLLAFVAGYEAATTDATRRPWRRHGAWVAAGVAAGLAALCKQPAGVVLLALLWWTWRHDRLRGVVAVLAGFTLAHVPITLHYAAHGHVLELWQGYLLNPWAPAYIGARQAPFLSELWEGVMATTHVLTIPLVLAGFAWCFRQRETSWLRAWTLTTLAAAWVGFRFYKGYFLPVAAPLCLLAAAPWGLLGARYRGPNWLRGVAAVVLAGLVVRQVYWIDHVRDSRSYARDRGARTIAEHVAKHTDPNDQIWIWGWHLWGVYALADRMSASRVYKSLGLITPPNDNTWRRPGTDDYFVDGPAAQLLLDDLRRNRPAYIVLGSSVPHHDFDELRKLLRREYRRDRRVKLGRVQFWQRRDDAN